MAFAAGVYTLSVTFVDKNGNESTKDFQIQKTVYADVLTAAAAVVAAYKAATKASVTKYVIHTNMIEGSVVAATSDMPVSTFVSITTALATAGKKANYAIPMPVDAIMSGNDLIKGDALAEAVQGLYLSGAQLYISDEELAVGAEALSGVLVTRARRL